MIRLKSLGAAVLACLLPLSVAEVSFAQWEDDEEEEEAEDDDEDAALEDDDKALNFNTDVEISDDDEETSAAPASQYERQGTTYYFLGARYRGLILPQAYMKLFGEGGDTFYNNAYGPELGVRKDDFEMVFAGWWANYRMEPFAFKGSSDPEDAWEVIESKLKAVNLTIDFLWTSRLSGDFSILYGFGAGLGIVWGNLTRVQAYPVGEGGKGPYARCTGSDDRLGEVPVGDNSGMVRDYCDTDNDHYDGYKEPNWLNGGSVPLVLPWLSGQAGVRYRPHEKLAFRLEGGVQTTGLFFGFSGAYQL